MEVPCGYCIGCRLDRARAWAIRCTHEAQMHRDNCFITLTYRPEDLPADKSLDVTHFQNFMKYLRRDYGAGIRFFHCGEYGEQNARPHYHACLFGHDFKDKQLLSVNKKTGQKLFQSKALSELWTKGHASVGTVTFQSAGYVARYITKKVNGDQAEEHYWSPPDEHGETHQLKPEYTTMSRRPGIGRSWFEKYWKDLYPDDFVTMKLENGGIKKHPVPRYYDKLLEELDPDLHEHVVQKRVEHAHKCAQDNTDERLMVREFCKRQQMRRLERPMEQVTNDPQDIHRFRRQGRGIHHPVLHAPDSDG